MKRGEESCAVKREKDHPQAVKGRAGSSAHENSVCGTTRSTGEQRGLLRVHLSRSSCIRPLFSITHGAPGYVFLSVMSSSLSCFSAADWTSREELLFTTPDTDDHTPSDPTPSDPETTRHRKSYFGRCRWVGQGRCTVRCNDLRRWSLYQRQNLCTSHRQTTAHQITTSATETL